MAAISGSERPRLVLVSKTYSRRFCKQHRRWWRWWFCYLPIDFENMHLPSTTLRHFACSCCQSECRGINTSGPVLEVTHGFETWGGLFVDLASTLIFTQTNIDLKIYAPVTGTIRVKIENSSNRMILLKLMPM